LHPWAAFPIDTAAPGEYHRETGHETGPRNNMRFILYSGLLVLALVLAGCQTTCDVRGPSDICEIHHAFMHADLVSNTKRPPPSQEYLEARAKGFVHARPFLLPAQCDRCLVNICDDCVRAEQFWQHEHPGQK